MTQGEGLPPLAAVIWDIDNTLADSTSLAYTATNRVLASRGLPEIDMAGCVVMQCSLALRISNARLLMVCLILTILCATTMTTRRDTLPAS